MAIVDCTTSIGGLICGMTQTFTGNEFITLIFIMMFFMGLCMAFKLPLEVSAFIILPWGFVTFLAGGQLAILGLLLIYISVLLAKNIWWS